MTALLFSLVSLAAGMSDEDSLCLNACQGACHGACNGVALALPDMLGAAPSPTPACDDTATNCNKLTKGGKCSKATVSKKCKKTCDPTEGTCGRRLDLAATMATEAARFLAEDPVCFDKCSAHCDGLCGGGMGGGPGGDGDMDGPKDGDDDDDGGMPCEDMDNKCSTANWKTKCNNPGTLEKCKASCGECSSGGGGGDGACEDLDAKCATSNWKKKCGKGGDLDNKCAMSCGHCRRLGADLLI